jgi:Tfp pilus assembly protein PilO
MPSLRANTLVMTLAATAGAAAYLWFSFLPQKHAIAAIHSELSNKLNYATEAAGVAVAIHRIVCETAEIDEYVKRWGGMTATSVEVSTMFGQIAEAIQAEGIETTRFTPEPPVAYAQIRKIPLRVGCRGSHAEIGRLLAAIEALPYRIWVEELSIEAGDKDTQDLTCEITLVIFANNPEKSG